MGIQEKYKMALLQLQEYSDNELIFVNGQELNVQEELDNLYKQDSCPKCKSNKIRLLDNSPLEMPELEDVQERGYDGLDNLIHVYVQCDACGQVFTNHGDIAYRKNK